MVALWLWIVRVWGLQPAGRFTPSHASMTIATVIIMLSISDLTSSLLSTAFNPTPTPPPCVPSACSSVTGDGTGLPLSTGVLGASHFTLCQICASARFQAHWSLLFGSILFFKTIFIYVAAADFSASCRILSCGMQDLVPWPGFEPGPPALGAQSPSHWTTREVPKLKFLAFFWIQCLFLSLCFLLIHTVRNTINTYWAQGYQTQSCGIFIHYYCYSSFI